MLLSFADTNLRLSLFYILLMSQPKVSSTKIQQQEQDFLQLVEYRLQDVQTRAT